MKTRDVVALACVGAAALACNAILGLQEPTVVDSLDGASDAAVCAHDCLGGACDAGVCMPVEIATQQNAPIFMTQSTDRVFWANYGGSSIASADKVDGSNAVLAAGPIADQPFGIDSDDASVYVANSGASGTLLRCSFTLCTQQSILYDAGANNSVLAVYGGLLYWMQPDLDDISVLALDGGAVTQLAQPDTANNQDFVARLATDGTYVYWSEPANHIIRRQWGAASPQTIFDTGVASYPSAILVEQGTIYFATFGPSNATGTVGYGKVDGSGGAQTLATAQRYPFALAVDDTYLYWTNEGDLDTKSNPLGNGSVMRCAKTGCNGAPEELASGLVDPRGIVVDARAIYFATMETGNGDGKIYRLAKP